MKLFIGNFTIEILIYMQNFDDEMIVFSRK